MCQPRCPNCSEYLKFRPDHNESSGIHGLGEVPGRDVPACWSCPECSYQIAADDLAMVEAEPEEMENVQ
jgi:hypothetical protein